MKKLMVVAAALVFMAGPAMAADWNFYGSARVSTFYTDFEQNPFKGGVDSEEYEQNLHGNARIGANITVNDELTGRFEYGAQGGDVNARILWGEWNFGAGSLGVGKHYTPLLFPYSNQVYNIAGFNKGDINMSAFGMLYGSRKNMVRLTFGDFEIAAVEPKNVYTNQTFLQNNYGWSTETKFPSIQAKYGIDGNKWHLRFAGGYQTFDIKANNKDYEVDSWIVGIGGRLDVGAAYFKGNVWGGQNVGTMADILVNNAISSGPPNLDGDGWGYAVFDGTQVIDKDALAALIVAGYKIREGLYLEAGYGYVETELDTPGAVTDDADSFYIQSTIFLAPGVFLTPEIGMHDLNQNNAKVNYYGIKWQINF
ncbi:MAG: porin [Desulfobacteraceae bacterium]|nr:porin [Desulfobacteraceae bacterium]